MSAADVSSFPPNHYPEFRAFVDHTESGLWMLFQNIDRNNNGEIDKNELKTAFAKSGLTVSSAKLDDFFRDVDTNKDGVISYQEWRWATPSYILSSIQTTNEFSPEISCSSSLVIRHPTFVRSCHITRPRAI